MPPSRWVITTLSALALTAAFFTNETSAGAQELSREIHNAAFTTCMKAKEKLPQIPVIRRTPDTTGDYTRIVEIKITDGGIVLSWETVNFYTDESTRVVLRGRCQVSADGLALKGINVLE